MDNNNEYIPYGEEWVKEMMKFPKPLLIEKLSAALQSVTLVEEKELEGKGYNLRDSVQWNGDKNENT